MNNSVGFSQANSTNLPTVNVSMVTDYFKNTINYMLAETRSVKAERSARESYGDNAVGYAEVKREGIICNIKARLTPEHKVRKKPYSVVATIDEQEEKIISSGCEDCAACKGGCKHAIALVMWLHRRSEEPSPTEVTSYWKKARLSRVGLDIKYVKVKDLVKKTKTLHTGIPQHSLLELTVQHMAQNNIIYDNSLFKYKRKLDGLLVTIDKLLANYLNESPLQPNVDSFLIYCSKSMTCDDCKRLFEITKMQVESSIWHYSRYARITASKLYDIVHCKKSDGTLVEMLLGCKTLKSTPAMERGRKLEALVLEQLSNKLGKISKVGLYLTPEHSLFGASPDGICEDAVVEVKCPFAEKSITKYILKNGNISSKVRAQLQLQMHLAKVPNAFLCVASPDFITTKNVMIVKESYDPYYIQNLMEKAEMFWKTNVFPILLTNFL